MKFKRTFLKHDIVKKLYPTSRSIRSGMNMLRKEINASKELRKRISNAGPTKKHYYNKNQLKIILEYLNVDENEFDEL